jgi:zinc protease
VINIVSPIQLKPGAPDAIPSSVMNSLLGNGSSGRLYKNLREKYGFTYGAYSTIQSDKLVGNFTASASVRNEKTDSAIGQFLLELNRIRSEAVTAEDVSRTKNEMSGGFARSLESPSTIANFALNIARYNLPKDYYQNYLKNLAAVDNAIGADDGQQNMYNQVMFTSSLLAMPNRNRSKGLEKYGEVRYFRHVYGNEKAAPTEKKIAAGVTAESILQKSITAQGGEAAMKAIKDVYLTGSANIMGQKLDYAVKYISPLGYLKTISMGPNVVQKELVKGDVYAVSQQGMEQKVEEDDKEELNESAALFLESYLLSKKGYTYTVKGIEPVAGKDAYNVEVKSPKGKVFNLFYDVTSGLRVKEVRTQDGGPAGKITQSVTTLAYKTYNGVQLPVKQLLEVTQIKLDFDITDVKVNTGLKLDDLK